MGAMLGKTKTERELFLSQHSANEGIDPYSLIAGAETTAQLQSRIRSFLSDLIGTHSAATRSAGDLSSSSSSSTANTAAAFHAENDYRKNGHRQTTQNILLVSRGVGI